MSDLKLYPYTMTELTAMVNQAKEATISALANEGILTRDPREVAQSYALVMYQKGWFGRQWDKWRGLEEGECYLVVVKNVPLEVLSDEPKEHWADTRYLRGVECGRCEVGLSEWGDEDPYTKCPLCGCEVLYRTEWGT
jgi:hypothetical protein